LSVKTKASPLVSNALAQIETLQLQVKELPELADDRSAWVDSARRRLDQIREILVALRRQASVGGRTQQ
jgi:hypothetical protein